MPKFQVTSDLKQMARVLGCSQNDLIALSRNNDPFIIGRSKTEREKAEWFKDLWIKLGFEGKTKIHIRRVYYTFISQKKEVLKHDGSPFYPTDKDWKYLEDSSKFARCINLVDPMAFSDHRNPEPYDFSRKNHGFNPDECPGWTVSKWWEDNNTWYLPSINLLESSYLEWDLPDFKIHGFDYDESLQPYHIEVWCEKSTMNDVLIPICQRYGAVLVTGVGFMSITAVISLLNRIKNIEKPVQIFYISDFDPSGAKMPIAVARQVEYWLKFYDLDLDVKLTPLVLTKEQVEKYNLPRVPAKDTDSRKKNFESTYGEGAVELDALEALYPGELSRILTEKIMEFRDENLEARIHNERNNFADKMEKIWENVVEPYQDDLDEIEEELEPIIEKYNNKIAGLDKKLQKELEPIRSKLKIVGQSINYGIENIEVDLPDKPHAEVNQNEEWLFDSKRDYLDQIKYYKANGQGSTADEEDSEW